MSSEITGGPLRNHERTPKPGRSPGETLAFPTPGPPEAYVFLGWTLDLRRHSLLKDGDEAHLRVKAYDVLLYLVRNAGRVVGKQELLDGVWGDVAVTEDSLVQCLMEIRRALGDEQGAIKTVRGRGYLFDALVETRAPSTPPLTFPRPPVVSPAITVELVTPAATTGTDATTPHRRWWLMLVAAAIAAAVGLGVWWVRQPSSALRLTAQQTLNPEARQAYEQGIGLVDRLSQSDIQQARQLFARAVELDPAFAAAHAALAFQLEVLSAFGVERPNDVLPQAMVSARRAVELDPTLSAGWTALAHAFVQGAWDWPQAEAAYRRAIALDPKDPRPQYLLAHMLIGIGRTQEALEYSRGARALQPRSARLVASNGIMLYLARQHDAARQAFVDAIALDDRHPMARFWMALNEISRGDLDTAMTAALAARAMMANQPTWVVGYVHAAAGRRAEAREVLQVVEAQRQTTYVSATDLALLHVGLGDHDAALDWLETAVREHARWMEITSVLPMLDPLRGNPRFQKILQAVNLTPAP